MGEITDMMLDGTVCQSCGVWLNEGRDGAGCPGYCADCEPENDDHNEWLIARTCPDCGKVCKSADGVKQHQRDKHTNTEMNEKSSTGHNLKGI